MPPRKRQSEYFVATTSGTLMVNGKRETFVKGRTILHRSEALYQAHPELFAPIDHANVEQATAAPGERR